MSIYWHSPSMKYHCMMLVPGWCSDCGPCGVSLACRECIPSIHRRNKKCIKRELMQRGVTITPDSELKVKLPSGSLWTRIEVLLVLNSTLKASYTPLAVCDFLTSDIKLQYTGPESVLQCLDNGSQWGKAINNCEDIL